MPRLYRIHRAGHPDLDYIGQAGSGAMTLRKQFAMLSGVVREVMLYGDPHTGAPALWALRHTTVVRRAVALCLAALPGGGKQPYTAHHGAEPESW
jgi:hypothetical protein